LVFKPKHTTRKLVISDQPNSGNPKVTADAPANEKKKKMKIKNKKLISGDNIVVAIDPSSAVTL
jgi:hypothetical protein